MGLRQRGVGAARGAMVIAAGVAMVLAGCAGPSASAGDGTTTTVHRTTTMTASTTTTTTGTVIDTATATHTARSTMTATVTPTVAADMARADRAGAGGAGTDTSDAGATQTTGTAANTPAATGPTSARSATPATSETPRAPAAKAGTTTSKTTTSKTIASKITARASTAAPTTSSAPAKPDFGIPVKLGNARQLITVTADSPSATTATLKAWQQGKDGRWRVVIGPIPAHVGSAGIGKASETTAHTPRGTFTLTEAFGSKPDPGSGLRYRQTDNDDWWVSDVHSPDYNTWQSCAKASCPFNTSVSEHLHGIWQYAYAIVMDYNRSPAVPGAGSAFFLHITDGHATAGCISIAQQELVKILRWLTPGDHPRIATGIG